MVSFYRSERQIKFINLDGLAEEYTLEDDEQLLSIKCPLDKTYLVSRPGIFDPFVECKRCGLQYDNHDLSQEKLQKQLQHYISQYNQRLNQIDKEKSQLTKFLDFVKTQGQILCTDVKDSGYFGKHPHKKEDGFIHPHKKH